MGLKRTIKKNQAADLILIKEAFEDFYAEKVALNLSDSTLRNYRQSYEYFMEFCDFDDATSTEEVTQQLFFQWMNTMNLEGISTASINHYLRDVRAFFYWCMDDSRKYVKSFRIEMIKGQEESLKLFSQEDITLLLEKPKKGDGFTDWRTWAIVSWVLGTGNRARTICNVKIEDVNFNKKEISLKFTKNKKAQVIPLSSALETVIKEYLRIWRDGAAKDTYLFPNIGEEQLTTNALRHSFSKYCKDRGVNQTNIHGLRHNFAKAWLQNNGNMFVLQKVLGHQTLEMTRRYVKLFGDDLKEDFDKFNPLDNLKKSARRTQTVKRSLY